MTDVAATKGIVYCAGPMFSHADQAEQQRVADELESHGYTAYLPQRDGLEVAALLGHLSKRQLHEAMMLDMVVVARFNTWVTRAVYALDVYQVVQRCHCVVLNVDGRVPDEGSIVETAIAFCSGVPIVLYKTTGITMLSGYDNPMVTGICGWIAPVVDIPGLVPAVEKEIAKPSFKIPLTRHPRLVRQLAKLGQDVWSIHEGTRTTLSPRSLREIEPQSTLRTKAASVVAGVIRFSQIPKNDTVEQERVVGELLRDMRDWAKDQAIRDELIGVGPTP